jgi:hypothetical protein
MRKTIPLAYLLIGALAGCTGNYKRHEANTLTAIQEINNLAGVLETVKDRESAKAAAPRVEVLVQTLDDLKTRDNALPKLAKEDEDRLANAYKLAMEDAQRRMIMALIEAQKKADGEPAFLQALTKLQALGAKFNER